MPRVLRGLRIGRNGRVTRIEPAGGRRPCMAEGDTFVNALIGAVVGVVLSPIPFSTVIGGAVAGYLQGGDRDDGVRVGALAGAIMLVPIALLAFVVGNIFFFAVAGSGMPGPAMGMAGGFTILAIVVFLLFGLVYVVAFAAVGGYLGNYVKQDTDVDL